MWEKDIDMKKNVGSTERVIRVILGAALILGYFLNPDGTYSWLYWIGLIPLVTGLIGSCPLWAVLGINTNKGKE
jgi:hypothetical protein